MLQIFDHGHLAEFENRKKVSLIFFVRFKSVTTQLQQLLFLRSKLVRKIYGKSLKNQSCNINKIYDFVFVSLLQKPVINHLLVGFNLCSIFLNFSKKLFFARIVLNPLQICQITFLTEQGKFDGFMHF